MQVVIGIIVALLLIWIGIKVVKLVFKILLWLLALGIILGLLSFYFPFQNNLRKELHPEHRIEQPVKSGHASENGRRGKD
jgi:hypothetical protein